MGFDVTNQVQKQVADHYVISSSASSLAPAKDAPAQAAQAQDTLEKAPAQGIACSSSSSSCLVPPAKVAPPAPEKAPRDLLTTSSSTMSAPPKAPKAPQFSVTTSSSEEVAQKEQCGQPAQAVGVDTYRTRLNRDIGLAEGAGSNRAAREDMREIAVHLIKQHGNMAYYDARLEPLRASHRKAVIEANMRAQKKEPQDVQKGECVVHSVPGGGIYQWAKAVHSVTHPRKVKDCDRDAAIALLRTTQDLVEDAESNTLGDHKWRLSYVSRGLKRHLRKLLPDEGAAAAPEKAAPVKDAKEAKAEKKAGSKKGSFRARVAGLFHRKGKKSTPAKGAVQAQKADVKQAAAK